MKVYQNAWYTPALPTTSTVPKSLFAPQSSRAAHVRRLTFAILFHLCLHRACQQCPTSVYHCEHIRRTYDIRMRVAVGTQQPVDHIYIKHVGWFVGGRCGLIVDRSIVTRLLKQALEIISLLKNDTRRALTLPHGTSLRGSCLASIIFFSIFHNININIYIFYEKWWRNYVKRKLDYGI